MVDFQHIIPRGNTSDKKFELVDWKFRSYISAMQTWILFTILAVIMQSVRTAGQKQISKELSVQATTLARFLFGLPFVWLYFGWLNTISGKSEITPQSTFFLYATLAAIAQIIATVLLIKALTIRNFAVGTALAKTEALMTALLASVFFSATMSLVGYLSVFIGVTGALIASKWKMSCRDLKDNESIKYGLGAGLGFGLASVWLREASLSLLLNPLLSAATTLVYMVSLQALICIVWITNYQREQFRLIAKNIKACLFIGFTGVAGSIGWFTALSLQQAALVKTLGQTDFIMTLAITWFYFGEKVSIREYMGIALIIISVVLLLQFS